jgi:hypothetical protein
MPKKLPNVIKFTKFFRSVALKNLPKMWFLVCKYTIWQPWSSPTRHLFNDFAAARVFCRSPKSRMTKC